LRCASTRAAHPVQQLSILNSRVAHTHDRRHRPHQVLAVGESVELQVKAGDMIVYNKYAMAEVEVPAGEVVFVAEKSVLGKLE